MLEIRNTQVYGLERSLLAAGNAMSVGEINTIPVDEDLGPRTEEVERGERLGKVPLGTGHDHFLLGIHVQCDIKYPQYWTIEAERYHNFEIITSQSKMHRLTAMAKDAANFPKMFNKYVDEQIKLNVYCYCAEYTEAQNPEKKYYWFMKAISNLPMGFELWMTVDLTYLQLKTIYFQRRSHKLKEDWGVFCDWCETLPYFKQFVLKKE